MGKDIESLLKEIDDIEVPESISMFTDEVLVALPEKKKKKKIFNLKKAASAAAIVIITGVTVSYAFPSFAEAVPVLKDVVTFFRDNKVLSEDILKYTKEIKQTVSDKGITLEVQKVMLTDSTLKIFYTVETEKHMEWGAKVNYSNLYIDGKKVEKGNERNNRVKISKEGETEKYACVTTLDVSRVELKDEFDVRWDIKSIHLYDGKWRVAFKADRKEISKETHIFNPNYIRECEGVRENFEKIVVSPIETSVTVKLDEKSLDEAYEKIGIAKEKRLGKGKVSNEEWKKMSEFRSKTVYEPWDSIIIDDKGNRLRYKDSNYYTDGLSKVTYFFSGLKEKPKSLTFIPFEWNNDEVNREPRVKVNLGSIESIKSKTKIDIGENEVLVIDEIERKGNKIKINYSFESKHEAIVRGGVHLIDNKDNEEAYQLETKAIHFDIDSSNELNKYCAEYEIHENNSYRLEVVGYPSSIKINEDKKFTIELKD